jgi:hypothetical protein
MSPVAFWRSDSLVGVRVLAGEARSGRGLFGAGPGEARSRKFVREFLVLTGLPDSAGIAGESARSQPMAPQTLCSVQPQLLGRRLLRQILPMAGAWGPPVSNGHLLRPDSSQLCAASADFVRAACEPSEEGVGRT